MLLTLNIQNLAIMPAASLRFAPGLCALTGETGAGKSVVLQALALAAGGRASQDLIRTGADALVVEATFSTNDRASALLESAGIQPGPQVVVRRTVPARGGGRATVNGRTVTLGWLAELGRALVDIAGQHDQHGLLDPATHLDILDQGGQVDPTPMRAAWAELCAARAAESGLDQLAEHAEARAAWLQSQLQELDGLALRPGEVESLQAERRVLEHAEQLGAGVRAAEGLLYSGAGAAAERVAGAEAALRRLESVDPSLAPLAQQLRELGWVIDDVSRALQSRARVTADPRRLDALMSRLSEVERLCRKHRCSAEDLVLRRGVLQAELARIEDLDAARAGARERRIQAEEGALAAAQALRAERARAAQVLQGLVEAELQALAMPHARFGVAATPRVDGVAVGEACLGEDGLDSIEFLLSANPGEDLRPLARVASGGELSRVMLALRVALRTPASAPTLVFDEVDAGLGGRAASVVGERLSLLAQQAQVLCITHLPAMAARADLHLGVAKIVADGRTTSAVEVLDGEARAAELARMLGGDTEAALTYARRLLPARRKRAA